MITKKILIIVVVLVVSAIGIKAFAHSLISKETKVKHITDKMTQKLSLTGEQKALVFQINLERAQAHVEACKQGRKKGLIRNAVAKWKSDLKQVLNAEQAQKLKI